MTKPLPSASTASSRRRYALDAVRGVLIGTAETVPGVSGGTVALIIGVYETLLTSAGHLLSGIRRSAVDLPRGRGTARANEEFGKVQWRVLVPVLIGMFAALLLVARFMEGWVRDYPVQTSALFFGLVLASLYVPYSMAAQAPRRDPSQRAWGWSAVLSALAAAAVSYFVVSLPPADVQVNPLVIIVAAAVAVSALVLPGLSGSFVLLTFGLYETTLGALNDRDFGFIGLFLVGALVGLASIVKLLQWLLEHWQRITLVILTGVMAGSLRALWPWQDDSRNLLAPTEHVGSVITMALLGFAVVVVTLVVGRRRGAATTMRTEADAATDPASTSSRS